MVGIAEIALGAAPIAGGALLGIAAGGLKGPDFRGTIKADLDLLDRLPPEQSERRAALERSIELRIDDLVAANEKSRQLRAIAGSYEGNWRDIVLVLCAILFTVIWWNVPHGRSNWLLLFIVMIGISIAAAFYAFRGIRRGLRRVLRRKSSQPDSTESNSD